MAAQINPSNDDSDSEEDRDYAPSKREVAEAEREERLFKKRKLNDEDELLKPMKVSAKVVNLWSQLKGSGAALSGPQFSYARVSAVGRDPKANGSIPASEQEWMRQYGITTVVPQRKGFLHLLTNVKPVTKEGVQQEVPQTEATAEASTEQAKPGKAALTDRALNIGLAAQALALAKGGSSSTAAQHDDKIAVTEVRRFAGKDVLVSKMASKEEAEKLQRKEAEKKSGLDSVLASLQTTKKVTVMDKSKDDWRDLKKSDAQLEEELEAYKKSGGKYLDKVDFLKRSELREYEAERDNRLQNDMRTRART